MSGSKMFVLSPTGKRRDSGLQLANRPVDLQGKTVGLVYNGEWWMEELLLQRYDLRETPIPEIIWGQSLTGSNIAIRSVGLPRILC